MEQRGGETQHTQLTCGLVVAKSFCIFAFPCAYVVPVFVKEKTFLFYYDKDKINLICAADTRVRAGPNVVMTIAMSH